MAVCWIAVVMVFFTFSTTQEYYSMPIYPGTGASDWLGVGRRRSLDTHRLPSAVRHYDRAVYCAGGELGLVWRTPAPGDISQALSQNPDVYTLSMGHIFDLTLGCLRVPQGAARARRRSLWFRRGLAIDMAVGSSKTVLALAVCMIVFLQAARLALVVFDPYLGSYPLAVALEQSPPGKLIGANEYYAFSSVYFYANRSVLLWNGRGANLEYGSYAPGAPQVFIDDPRFVELWNSPSRVYLLTYGSEKPHVERLVGSDNMIVVKEDGGNFLLTNQPLP